MEYSKERLEKTRFYQIEGRKFEELFEQTLKDMNIEYVKGFHTPWDFVIIAPHSKTFIELKENTLHLSNPQKAFMEEYWRGYLIIIRKKDEYHFKRYDRYYGKPVTELIIKTDNIHKIVFYPILRMIICFLPFTIKSESHNIFKSYVNLSFEYANKYIENFDGMIPTKMGIKISPTIMEMMENEDCQKVESLIQES